MKIPFLACLILPLCLAACGDKNQTENPNHANAASAPVAKGKTYKVAIEPLYPPFVQNADGGGMSGFDVDLLNAAAEKGGFQLTFHARPWEGIFDSLNTGEADIVAGSITVLDERKTQMDFSDPYFETTTVLLTHNNSGINTFADARNKNITFKAKSSSEAAAQKYLGNAFKPHPTTSIWQSVRTVIAQESDATIGDSGVLMFYANQYQKEGLKIVYDTTLPKEQNAFAITKGNAELLQQLNNGLAATKADGTYHALYKKWFGNMTLDNQSNK